jgi:hypothetical protein
VEEQITIGGSGDDLERETGEAGRLLFPSAAQTQGAHPRQHRKTKTNTEG